MTKTEMIQHVAESAGQSKAEAERYLDAVLAAVSSALERGERLDLRGFGTFRVRETKARQGRNPRTGEVVTIAAKKVAVFKPSKDLADKVNRSVATVAAEEG
jgi:DNA-binding protein HU-beta